MSKSKILNKIWHKLISYRSLIKSEHKISNSPISELQCHIGFYSWSIIQPQVWSRTVTWRSREAWSLAMLFISTAVVLFDFLGSNFPSPLRVSSRCNFDCIYSQSLMSCPGWVWFPVRVRVNCSLGSTTVWRSSIPRARWPKSLSPGHLFCFWMHCIILEEKNPAALAFFRGFREIVVLTYVFFVRFPWCTTSHCLHRSKDKFGVIF